MNEIKILYHDDDIVVCIKPVGIISQASNGESMITLLSNVEKSEIFPLHRLDRDVSGIMVYAKNKRSAAFLSREISEQKLKKEYIAVVHGIPEENEGIMKDLLFKDSSKNKSYVVKRMRKGVKEASLEYKTLSSTECDEKPMSKVHILLHTGRTHQIRVQFSSRKMPLVGDKKYGAVDNFKQIGLWSYRLSFTHPKTKEYLTFSHEPDNYIFDI